MGDGAPVAVLIDGYNILHAIPRFAPRGSDPAPARERFESWLAAAAARQGVGECVLIWDGRRGGRRDRRSGSLTVLTTPGGLTADDRILDLCRGAYAGRAAFTWVVSSDRDVQIPARELGFVVLGATTFYRKWSAAGSGRGAGTVGTPDDDPGETLRPRLTRADVDELLDEFLDADPGSE